VRRAWSLFVLVVFALVVSGCYRSDLEIEVNDDGSGTYTQLVAINLDAFTEMSEQFGGGEEAGLPEDPCAEMTSEAESGTEELPEGVEVEAYRDGDFCGVKFTAQFDDVAELEDIFGQISSETESQGFGSLSSFVIEQDGDGWFFEATPSASSGESMGDDTGMFEDFMEGASNIVRVKLPGEQVEHNADRIDDDGTMIWNLDVLGDTRTLTARTEPGDPITDEVFTDAGEEVAAQLGGSSGGSDDDGGSSTIWIILGIVVVAAAVVGFVLWKRSRGASPTPAVAGASGAAGATGLGGLGGPGGPVGPGGDSPTAPPIAGSQTGGPAAAGSGTPGSGAPASGGPQWDPQRNAYVQWDPAGNRWLQYDDAAKEWKPLV
jgi:hypothetical protein